MNFGERCEQAICLSVSCQQGDAWRVTISNSATLPNKPYLCVSLSFNCRQHFVLPGQFSMFLPTSLSLKLVLCWVWAGASQNCAGDTAALPGSDFFTCTNLLCRFNFLPYPTFLVLRLNPDFCLKHWNGAASQVCYLCSGCEQPGRAPLCSWAFKVACLK